MTEILNKSHQNSAILKAEEELLTELSGKYIFQFKEKTKNKLLIIF